jgi:hypothetical protein
MWHLRRNDELQVQDGLLDVTPESEGGDRPRVDVVASVEHQPLVEASMQGLVNGMLHADGISADGKSCCVMEVTPLDGCPSKSVGGEPCKQLWGPS